MEETQKLNQLEEGGEDSHTKVFERHVQPTLYEQALRAPPRIKLFGVIGVLAVIWFFNHVLFASSIQHTPWTLVKPRYLGHGGRWPGFKSLKHLVILGDSYSETAFNPDGPLPSVDDPLGNPPDHAAWTSSNGPNWAMFLPLNYNQSFLKVVNMAHGGATVDQDTIPQYHPAVRSLKRQTVEGFIPKFGGFSPPANFSWKQEDTLFIIWMGINDVHNTFSWKNGSQVQKDALHLYAIYTDKLYETGARNFLFMAVPPTDLSPLTMHEGAAVQAAERADIINWNDNIMAIAKALHARYLDVSTFMFDTHALFTQIIHDPCSHPETCKYKETAEWCPGYRNGTPTWYSKFDTCNYAIDEYFWKDALHPTFRVHNATAKMVAKFLAAIPQN